MRPKNKILTNEIQQICQLMEDIAQSPQTPLSRSSTSSISMVMPPEETNLIPGPSVGEIAEPEEPQFTELEIKITNRFLELVGGAAKARDLIDKCDECAQCLGIDSEEPDDYESIESVAAMIPSDVDLPTSRNMPAPYSQY